jgi:hypothetical protein
MFHKMRKNKLNQMRSENSEDSITWNVFRSLLQINPKMWYPFLLSYGLGVFSETSFFEDLPEEIHLPEMLNVKIWESIKPPSWYNLQHKLERPTEVDVIIECEEFVWFIETKYKSDISLETANDNKSNKVIRNLDVGTLYAGIRDFYFSILILDDRSSKKGVQVVRQYNQELQLFTEDFLEDNFAHRNDGLQNLRGLSVFYWQDLSAILKYCSRNAENQFEGLVAENAYNWIKQKDITSVKDWLDEDLNKKYLSYPKELTYILKIQEFAKRNDEKYMKVCMPTGFAENGWPTNSTLENYDYLCNYWNATELAFNQFDEFGLPWWWRNRSANEFSLKFFEVLEDCEELGYMSEEEYWELFESDSVEALKVSYFLLFNWYELREK